MRRRAPHRSRLFYMLARLASCRTLGRLPLCGSAASEVAISRSLAEMPKLTVRHRGERGSGKHERGGGRRRRYTLRTRAEPLLRFLTSRPKTDTRPRPLFLVSQTSVFSVREVKGLRTKACSRCAYAPSAVNN